MRHIFTQCRADPEFILAANQLSIRAVHQHHALFTIDLAQPHLDDLAIGWSAPRARKLRLNGHLAMSSINKHADETRFGLQIKQAFIAARIVARCTKHRPPAPVHIIHTNGISEDCNTALRRNLR